MAGCFRRGTPVLTTKPWVARQSWAVVVDQVEVLHGVCEGRRWQHRELVVHEQVGLRLRHHHCERGLTASNAAVAAAAVTASAIVPDVASERVPAQHRLWMRRPTEPIVAKQSKVLHRVREKSGRLHRVLQL